MFIPMENCANAAAAASKVKTTNLLFTIQLSFAYLIHTGTLLAVEPTITVAAVGAMSESIERNSLVRYAPPTCTANKARCARMNRVRFPGPPNTISSGRSGTSIRPISLPAAL